jgi:FkbM family methyltransferase
MEKAIPKKEILDFFKEKKALIIRTSDWWGPLRARFFYFLAAKEGIFSFYQFSQLLLPSIFSAKKKLLPEFNKFLDSEIEKEMSLFKYTYDDGCVNLLGHKFKAFPIRDFLALVEEIIISDQYHIGEFIKEDSIIIDAGANTGVFSVFAASKAPRGYIYSFEPTIKTFGILQENTMGYKQITCSLEGLGDVSTQKKIFVKDLDSLGSIFEDSPFYLREKIRNINEGFFEIANITTVDLFVTKNDIPRIDFIKIDTEGYEAKILRGAKETIKSGGRLLSCPHITIPMTRKNFQSY